MSAKNISLSMYYSKLITEFNPSDFGIVIVMCGCRATIPSEWKAGKRFEDWDVTDPDGGSLEDFVMVRDEIEERIRELVMSVLEGRKPGYKVNEDGVCTFRPPKD